MKKLSMSLILVIGAILAFWIGSLFAEEYQENDYTSELKRISTKQDEILEKLSEIKSELEIIKVRATNR